MVVGDGAPHSREEGEPVGADLEEVTAGDAVGAAELEDVDYAHRGQLFALGAEAEDAVGDGELGVLRDLFGGVFTDEEAGCSPACHVDREIVHERPDRRSIAKDVPHRLEAVDDDDGRLLALDPLVDRLEGVVGVSASDHRAQVDEGQALADRALVEEGELLHVLDELQRRLRERREVEALLALPSEVEQHLQREQSLPRAGLAGDHGQGPDR